MVKYLKIIISARPSIGISTFVKYGFLSFPSNIIPDWLAFSFENTLLVIFNHHETYPFGTMVSFGIPASFFVKPNLEGLSIPISPSYINWIITCITKDLSKEEGFNRER